MTENNQENKVIHAFGTEFDYRKNLATLPTLLIQVQAAYVQTFTNIQFQAEMTISDTAKGKDLIQALTNLQVQVSYLGIAFDQGLNNNTPEVNKLIFNKLKSVIDQTLVNAKAHAMHLERFYMIA